MSCNARRVSTFVEGESHQGKCSRFTKWGWGKKKEGGKALTHDIRKKSHARCRWKRRKKVGHFQLWRERGREERRAAEPGPSEKKGKGKKRLRAQKNELRGKEEGGSTDLCCEKKKSRGGPQTAGKREGRERFLR